MSRRGQVLAYGLVLLLSLELAVWECFLVPFRAFGVPLPVAQLLAVVGNVALGRAGAAVLQRPGGALAPAACWLVVALALASTGPLGDAVVPGNTRGVLFLLLGVAAAGASLGGWGVRAPRATPPGPSGR
jgi:hypothetical protein